MNAPAKPAVNNAVVKAAASTAQLLYPHVSVLPAYGKLTKLRNTRPGLRGDYKRPIKDDNGDGLEHLPTGHSMHPVPGSLLRFADCDQSAMIAAHLAAVPHLVDGFTTYRGDHCAFAFIAAYPLPNASRQENGHEIASLRGPGLYQMGPGSAHYDKDKDGNQFPTGYTYVGNGKKPIELTEAETDKIAAIYNVTTQVDKPAPENRRVLTIAPSDECEFDRAVQNLQNIDPDLSRSRWIAVAGALKDAFGDAGRQPFIDWSATGQKYREGEPDRVWDKYVKGSGKGATLKTLTYLANEHSGKQAARDWSARQKPAPAVLPTGHSRADLVSTDSSAVLDYPPELPLAVETAALQLDIPRSIIVTYRAALRAIDRRDIDPARTTIPELAEKCKVDGLTRQPFDAAIKVDRANCRAMTELDLQPTVFLSPLVIGHKSNPVTEPNTPEYRIATYPEFCEYLIRRWIQPRLFKAMFPESGNILWAGDADLWSEAELSDLSGQLTPHLTDAERQKAADVLADVALWRARLADTTPAAYPDGVKLNNAAALHTAIIERDIAPYADRPTSRRELSEITLLPERTISAAIARSGWRMEKNTESIPVRTVADLKRAPYARKGGKPIKVHTSADPHGVPYWTYSTTSEGKRREVINPVALDFFDTAREDGDPVFVEYSLPSIPRRMTDAEREQAAQARAEKRQRAKQSNVVKPYNTISEPRQKPYSGPGYGPDYIDSLISKWKVRLPESERSMFVLLSQPTVYEPPAPSERESDPPEVVTASGNEPAAPESKPVPDASTDLRPLHGPWFPHVAPLVVVEDAPTKPAFLARLDARIAADKAKSSLMTGD